ncbi:MAG: AAA family ATPase [Desulfovibrionaceae bacterium]|nr:AAA family ATPase [Desulfovibrionaceae bacterium]
MNHNEKAPDVLAHGRGQKAKEAAGRSITPLVDTVNTPGEKAGMGLDAISEPGAAHKLVAVDVATFLSMELPERGYILSPVIPTQGLVMLYAPRGMGKTYAALSIAYAVASGQSVMRWTAPSARRVLYLDGEMSANEMQERLASIIAGYDLDPPDPSYLKIITPGLNRDFMPNLATSEGQAALAGYLEGVDLVVVDNLATLARHGRENEAESWLPVQGWILELRRRGLSVLMIHHAGKGGNQRGTSSREDVLDTVIALKHPNDYQAEEGARFEVHLEKARGICGNDAKPFEAKLIEVNGGLVWTTADIEDVELRRVLELKAEGLPIRDIAEEVGLSRSKVQRLLKKIGEAA